VNFAPLAFAGFGAYLFRILAGNSGNMLWLPLVAVLCAPLGALVALPAARLKGLYLALASMAFAHAMAVLFFPNPHVFPGAAGRAQFQPLELFGWSFESRKRFVLLLAVCFGIVLVGLTALRRSSLGRRWVALNDSPAACATVGISVRQTTVSIYALSAAIAGFGGAFMAVQRGTLNELDFDLIRGLPYVLLGAVGGLAYPIAGLFAGISTILFVIVKDRWDLSIFAALEIVGPGLMAVGMVANQEGAVKEMGRGFAPLLPWRSDARADLAQEREAKREAEPGELGLHRPFTNDAVIDLDRKLGILDDVVPVGGYGRPGAPGDGGQDDLAEVGGGPAGSG
jgi:branched-chain amino acid transport system permease protein